MDLWSFNTARDITIVSQKLKKVLTNKQIVIIEPVYWSKVVFEELSTVQKLVKIISQKDAETAAKIMLAIMEDCTCAGVVQTPNEICKEVNRLVDFALVENFGVKDCNN